MNFSKKITQYKAIDGSVFQPLCSSYRNTFLVSLSADWSLDYDHSPELNVYFGILGWTVFEFSFYDVRHKEEE